jgi:hypothetical protein
MTKKHFEWAAAYVRRLRERRPGKDEICEGVEDAFADLFTRFGPRFDESRFRAACRGAARECGYEVRS